MQKTNASEHSQIHGLKNEGAARLAEADIVDRIYSAVLAQRLPPGTKLSESALCEAFQVSRMRIRRALLLLAGREIVELHSNRGAYISRPTPAEARSVFEARRTIEPTVISNVVKQITDEEITKLQIHMDAEKTARETNNRRDAIRLSGEFHVKLAGIGANAVLKRFVKELVARTSLIIGMFEAPGVTNCSGEEHKDLLDTIREKNADRAMELMLQHLHHIERDIDLTRVERQDPDIRQIFSE
ncbi:MAG: GntR family transcriptional regulator [Methyloligellaceae bacterium]